MLNFRLLRSSVPSIVVLSALLVAGCSGDDSNPVDNPGTTKHTVPGPGSSYTFTAHNVDSNGVRTSSDQTVIWTVTDNNLNYNGKSGAVKIVNGTKVGIMYHAPNGDLIAAADPSSEALGGVWVTYPFGSKGTFTYPTIDTTVTGQGGTSHVRFSGTVTYLGEEDVVVGGETIRAQKVLDKYSQSSENAGGPAITFEAENTLWYSPKVGYFVKQSTVASTIIGGAGFRVRNVADLTSYSLK